ncbi:alanine racemase [Alteromonadaceae bacterium M269]|nr:alanine racemase [Alteromonadaceae bacterium M269]
MSRPAKALIDIDALHHNCTQIRSYAPSSSIIAILKANAYGHGAKAIAKALCQKVDMIGVSCLEEAVEIRESDVCLPILLLEGCFSVDELLIASEQDFHVVVHCIEQLEAIEQTSVPRSLHVWLKVDTGMHRLGIAPNEASEYEARLSACEHVDNNIRLMSHFASADDANNPLNHKQMSRFEESKELIGKNMECSMANSAGILFFPESHFDWVRPGILLFGVSPNNHQHQYGELKPVMTLASQVISVSSIEVGETVGYGNRWKASRPSKIATVAIGYGDGYPCTATDGTPVLVNGQRVPLVGRVSMDMLTVDVTDIDTVKVGDAVELWGSSLSVNEVASHAGTLGYELLTRMPSRVIRSLA